MFILLLILLKFTIYSNFLQIRWLLFANHCGLTVYKDGACQEKRKICSFSIVENEIWDDFKSALISNRSYSLALRDHLR